MRTPDEFAAPKVAAEKLGKLNRLLERSGLDVDDISRVERVNLWEGFLKNADGDAEKVDLSGISLVPLWADGPEWPVVQPAAPTKIVYGKRPTTTTGTRTTLIFPDPQIGFLRHTDGTMTPMQDEAAMEASLAVARLVRPWRIVNLGDFIDMSEWTSKFVVWPEFVLTTQPALDRGHVYLAEQRAIVGPDGEVILLGGNHDDRLALAVARNAKAALRLKQANTPESWPVLSLGHLMRLDELGVEYITGYPAGRKKLASGHGRQSSLYAIHGEKLDVKKVAKDERQSFVQGHAHHLATHTETYEVDGEPVDVEAWSMGCLCALDGPVPSTKGGLDDHGHPVKRHENWQHAIGVLTEFEAGGWSLEPVRIRDGVAHFRGQEVRP